MSTHNTTGWLNIPKPLFNSLPPSCILWNGEVAGPSCIYSAEVGIGITSAMAVMARWIGPGRVTLSTLKARSSCSATTLLSYSSPSMAVGCGSWLLTPRKRVRLSRPSAWWNFSTSSTWRTRAVTVCGDRSTPLLVHGVLFWQLLRDVHMVQTCHCWSLYPKLFSLKAVLKASRWCLPSAFQIRILFILWTICCEHYIILQWLPRVFYQFKISASMNSNGKNWNQGRRNSSIMTLVTNQPKPDSYSSRPHQNQIKSFLSVLTPRKSKSVLFAVVHPNLELDNKIMSSSCHSPEFRHQSSLSSGNLSPV